MTVPVTKENENGYPGEYKEIEYLDAHFQVKGRISIKISVCLTRKKEILEKYALAG